MAALENGLYRYTPSKGNFNGEHDGIVNIVNHADAVAPCVLTNLFGCV